jgi:predicted metallopeptidase
MPIKYCDAEDIKTRAISIVRTLEMKHIDLTNVGFLRSRGSTSKGTIARCHALGKAMQLAMGRKKGFYLIEVISERFDKLSQREQTEVVIHELMHIPKTFGGGFIHHDKVNNKSVKKMYEEYFSKMIEQTRDVQNKGDKEEGN